MPALIVAKKIMKRDTLCEAIAARRLVEFRYDGMTRVVEPYTVGILTTGNVALSAWHVRGFSESRAVPKWRLYTLEKMGVITILNEEFEGPRRGYNPRDSRMDRIYCTF